MNSSLENLFKNLLKKKPKYLSSEFLKKQWEVVKQKRSYPYEYMNSYKRFDETKLAKKDGFYNMLNGKCIKYIKAMSMLWKYGINLK